MPKKYEKPAARYCKKKGYEGKRFKKCKYSLANYIKARARGKKL